MPATAGEREAGDPTTYAVPAGPQVRFWLPVAMALLSALAASLSAQEQIASARDLRRLSIEELAQIKVTSVSKVAEPLNQAAAAVFVITNDAIRRSGANSIPEVLRLAPNLQVARLDANTYAVTARGFNQSSGTANKLLVLIDGRAIYSPLFSGTFWDAQRTFIDDIDRIEVISGPGGTLWGANAVNGVINIITKSAAETGDWTVDARLGSLDRRLGVRYGAALGPGTRFRVYGLGLRQGSMVRADGTSTDDSWNHLQGGFRADRSQGSDTLTLQGDFYRGTGIGRPAFLPSGTISGGNVSATWARKFSGGSNLRVQTYFDNSRRLLVSGIDATVDQYALETQYDFSRGSRHALVVGAGYRITDDRFERGPGTAFLSPDERTLRFANVFAQDAIALSRRLKLAVGIKVEDNSYTGVELMPDARLSWSVSDRTMLWTSVARAVRTPSRFDTDLINPGVLAGGPDFQSEDLLANEVGYRGLLSPSLSLSVSAFYNVYDRLRTVEASTPAVFPLVVRNNMEGDTQGVETWANLAVRDWWHLSAGFSALRKNLRLAPGNRDVFGVAFAGNDPRYQSQLRSSMDLPRGFAVDVWLRNVGRLKRPAVPSYLEADARIAWQAADKLELSLDGQNLLHERHLEFVNPSILPSEVPRSLTLTARWTR
ncbi:MAG: iron complex outerrane recepter protein [Acidobacteriota bacterium]|nr:iron complex outerrane recepter protein [Acidobacteriota bacterium]